MKQRSEQEKAPATQKPTTVRLVWTKEGEARGAFSEHGRAVAGKEFETESGDLMIQRGWAEPVAK
jgi:hypothetical protein